MLSSVRRLDLSGNRLEGKVPTRIGRLGGLAWLDLSRNGLTGGFPVEILGLNKLKHVNLRYNHLCGEIPQGETLTVLPAYDFLHNDCLCGTPFAVCMAALARSSSIALVYQAKQSIKSDRSDRSFFSGFRSNKRYRAITFKKKLRTRESSSVSDFKGRMGGIVCCKSTEIKASLEEPQEFTSIRIHYHRKDHEYENWGLHAWGDINVQTLWEKPLSAAGSDDFGMFWDVRVKPEGVLNFIIHKGETKDFSGSIEAGDMDIWVVSEHSSVFKVKPDLTSVLKGNLSLSRAYWVSESLLAWNLDVEHVQFLLFGSQNAKLDITDGVIKGEDWVIALEEECEILPRKVTEKFPHIAHYKAIKLPAGVDVKGLVKSQLAIACIDENGERSLFVNLNDAALKPKGWDSLADEKPQLESFSDIVIYELHIRDFSVNDKSVDPNLRGTYLGFTSHDSAGMCHLKKLAESGLTHLHLLPSFHYATVDDNKENWKYIDDDKLASLPPDSEEQQAQIVAIQDEDGFNWGYDPILWGVPKGSYSTNPNGSCRTLEFRKMVQALNHIGLRVILDTVYNHLHASGPNDKGSVLDKVVPGYYLRRNADGLVENSACMNNTASEHYMVNRLIIDDLLLWATEYKVDGFRFDLMGHLMKSTMVSARNALDRLSKQKNGVDGSKIYIYGEGWDFGEVAHNGRGTNASQVNLAGTGIGSFNDRIRDSVLGGSPFGPHLQQGFVTGLFLQ
ncbi:hypothetical protein KI387_006514, partial [Taxus chinensis]